MDQTSATVLAKPDQKLEEQLAQMALIDGLTGIGNRRAFDAASKLEWSASVRSCLPLSPIMIDVDHFKLFNDSYGHQVGDDCLRAVAVALHSAGRRSTDLIARYGGEEFAVLLPDTGASGAETVATQILLSIAELHIPHQKNLEGGGFVSVSCGVCTSLPLRGGTTNTLQGLLQSADKALYIAKHRGRNCVATSILLATPSRLSNCLLTA